MFFSHRRVASVVLLGVALALAAYYSADGFLLMTRSIYLLVVGMGLAWVVLLLHQLAGNEDTVGLVPAALAAVASPLMCWAVYQIATVVDPSHDQRMTHGLLFVVSVIMLLSVAAQLLTPEPKALAPRGKAERATL
jgi:hypothetical protein